MTGFNPAIQQHQLALMSWADNVLGIKTQHDEPNDLKRQKGAAIPNTQTRLRHGSFQESPSQSQHAQSNFPSQYNSTLVHCTNVPSSNDVTKIIMEQQTAVVSNPKSSLRSKRKASHMIGPNPDGKRKPESEPPTKKRAGSRHNTLPQPRVPYQILCGKTGYVPAIVLFPGCSEGPFSVENTELLGVEECCHYDRHTNTLSCSNTAEICHPVQYLDIENPAHREVQWVEAASLKPLDKRVVLPVHYERVLKYMQKYGQSTCGTHLYTSFDHSALAERKGGETSLEAGKESYTTTPRDIAQRMAITRFV